MRVAAAQFNLKKIQSTVEFWTRIDELLHQSVQNKVQLVVFPEYFSLSLRMLESRSEQKDFQTVLRESLEHSREILKQAQIRAQQLKIAIVLGTLPWPENNILVNRSFFINEQGETFHQDKIFMTRFENEIWNVSPGEEKVQVFQWQNRVCAILTCYDSEFAVLSQTLVKAGVELLLVPSCTDTEHGYWRVRHCCEARAIENQMFVVLSSIVGGDPDHYEIDAHHGQGAIFSPCDSGFPANGLLKQGAPHAEDLCWADLDFKAMGEVRNNGSVYNRRDALRVQQVPFSLKS